VSVNRVNLARLRVFSFCFVLPGLLGLILSVIISTRYVNTLPLYPDPQNLRMNPRNINGCIIYQTADEDPSSSIRRSVFF